MDKVLLIGKFIDSTKHLQQELKKHLALQLCSDHVEVVSSMIQMYGPVLLLVNLDGFGEEQEGLFSALAAEYKDLPVVTFGDESQCERFLAFGETLRMFHIAMPADTETILAFLREHTDLAIGENDGANDAQQKLILLVDDSPVLLRSMKHMLEESYRVAMAGAGDDRKGNAGSGHP